MIQRTYRAADGTTVRADDDAVRAVKDALGGRAAAARQRSEPVLVAWDGVIDASSFGRAYRIDTEDGDTITGTAKAAGKHTLPLGYHELWAGDTSALIIAAPRRCYSGNRPREWGVFAPLYSLRRNRDQPIGDFADLAAVMQWIGEAGGDFVATLPVSAAFLRTPFDPSPYSPASRLFWNELYLTGPALAARGLPNSTLRRPEAEFVDYRAVSESKRAVLARLASDFFASDGDRTPEYLAYLDLYPDAPDYARFRAEGEGGDRDYHLYAQFAAHRQLSELAAAARVSGVRLYLDLPLGVHPDSYDVQRNPELFVKGVSVGAPPDPFFTNGQNWGFPPLHPIQLRAQRYAYWRKVLQTQLRYAGVLRLDHIMALHRLYVVPQGFEATRGVYLRFPAEELYAVLTLESARHQAVIVGEDLGTVPAAVRRAMARHGVKRMFVVQFEASENPDRPLPPVPKQAVASLNTHDMPPFRAYWEAGDADLRKDIGLLDDAGVREIRASRERTVRALSRMLRADSTLDTAAARTALFRFLGESRADMLLLNLEDLWLEQEPQNVPGTMDERPNWRRRLRFTLDEIRASSEIRELLGIVEMARRRPATGK